jgi:DnaJ-class molecular chaperone
VTLTCPKCEGIGWLRRTVMLAAYIYGFPRPSTVTRVCPRCAGKGTITLRAPHHGEEHFALND